MKILVGTSGYSYKEWRGHFYPDKLPPSEMLGYYAQHLDTVEINNTFYRMPTEKLLAGWAEKVPDGFSLVLKVSRRITHSKKLQGAEETLGYLMQTVAFLGDKLGPLLFQFPPYFKKDAERLREFLGLLPEWHAAFEFRSPTWFDDEVYDILRGHGVALVSADTDKMDQDGAVEIVPTADYGYLRLRRDSYDDERLDAWARGVLAQPWKEAHVFFKHEDEGVGPQLAARFNERCKQCRK